MSFHSVAGSGGGRGRGDDSVYPTVGGSRGHPPGGPSPSLRPLPTPPESVHAAVARPMRAIGSPPPRIAVAAPTHEVAGGDARGRGRSEPFFSSPPPRALGLHTHEVAGGEAHRRQPQPALLYSTPLAGRVYVGSAPPVHNSAAHLHLHANLDSAPRAAIDTTGTPSPRRGGCCAINLLALILGVALVAIGLFVQAYVIVTVGAVIIAFSAVRCLCKGLCCL